MDLTQGTSKQKNQRAKKMMLWFGIVSLIMTFAGLTSAFIVSSTREDWLNDFLLPEAFTYSTIVILLSSIIIHMAKRAINKNQPRLSTSLLLGTFILGIAFIYSQVVGFNQIIAKGYNFTGPTSNITMSYIYIIAVLHIVHVIAALLALTIVVIKHLKQPYTLNNRLGFDLASTFWHFVDILWLYLFFFLYFYNKIN